MRFVVLFLYLFSLIPHPGVSNTLCISEGEFALEGLHIPVSPSVSHSCTHSETDENSCDINESHHSHGDCYDYEDLQIRERLKSFNAPVTLVSIRSFDKLFADAPFRAPPVAVYFHHELPQTSQQQIVKTTVVLC